MRVELIDLYVLPSICNKDQREEIMSYSDIAHHLNRDLKDNQTVWKFKRLTAHEGPLTKEHPNYNGSTWNVMVEWENGEITSEPLTIIAADDPVTCAIYAREKGLLDLTGWKRFKSIANREKKLM